MTEVIYNKYYGGYGWSQEALRELGRRKCTIIDDAWQFSRDDKVAVALLKEWGSKRCSDDYAQLDIFTVPEGYSYRIDEYDGWETVIVVYPYQKVIEDLIDIIEGKSIPRRTHLTQVALETRTFPVPS